LVKARGLPWEATTQEIVDFFKDSNIVGGTAGVFIMMNFEGRPSGNCFVEMESEEDIQNAIAKDREKMGRRYIEVYKASESDMESEKAGKSARPDASGSDEDDGVVKLRGLPYGAQKSDVYDFFAGLEVEDNGVMMVADHTGRFKGEAFVQFKTVEDGKKALDKNKTNMGHRYIEVFPSSMSDATMTMARATQPQGGRGRGGGPMRGGGGYTRPSPYERSGGYGGSSSGNPFLDEAEDASNPFAEDMEKEYDSNLNPFEE